MKEEALAAALRSFETESDAILASRRNMDEDALLRAIEVLCAAPRIATSGCGHSGIACMHFAHSLCCIERPARFLSPSEAVHGATGFLQPDDVLVLASRGGKSDELLPIMEIGRKKGASVISVTENLQSPMARNSDIVIPMTVPRESDKFNSQGTASFVALSAVFDALQVGIMELTEYRGEQFALVHPGGAVGKRLNSPRK